GKKEDIVIETPYSCVCPTCWDDLPQLSGAIDWITVETAGCGGVDERALRTKLAAWSTEECGSSVHCGIRLPIAPEQILLGRLSCNATTGIGAISLVLLAGSERKSLIDQASLLPAPLLGAILQSREHLLAIALRAHLTTVQITQRSATVPRRTSPSTTPRTTPRITTVQTTVAVTSSTVVTVVETRLFFIPTSAIGIALAVGCFALAILALVIYSVWGRIEWKRLAEGRWKRRVYRKVPDVMFRSADEMHTVIPHSTSSHSTAHLIRY
ncbi:hypothetical protein PRIPAC_73601, partial [Pristionchus pacificus]|uniref:Uncharacterized protein n=1 Tax=Pristionchus pacificus TaxID=54126 RepID=A0A2A6C675_PRIPA